MHRNHYLKFNILVISNLHYFSKLWLCCQSGKKNFWTRNIFLNHFAIHTYCLVIRIIYLNRFEPRDHFSMYLILKRPEMKVEENKEWAEDGQRFAIISNTFRCSAWANNLKMNPLCYLYIYWFFPRINYYIFIIPKFLLDLQCMLWCIAPTCTTSIRSGLSFECKISL